MLTGNENGSVSKLITAEKSDAVPNGSKLEILTFSTLFPNASTPNHGVFVANRLRHLLRAEPIHAQVVAPVPWFPSRSGIFGKYGLMAAVPDTEDYRGINVRHPRFPVIPKFGMSIAPTLLFAACLPIMRQIQRERDFEIIDAHYFYPDGVAAVMLGRVLRKPVVITARGTDINLIPRHRLPRQQIKWAARKASGLVAVSQALKDALITLGVEPGRIEVLRNGVDLEIFRPDDRESARAQLNLNGPTLLSVGQLIERKANHLSIEALQFLPEFELLLVGEGPEKARLQLLARQLRVTARVRFLGSISHEKLAPIYSAADALLLASSREGWPNVLLEAMACGTPVVASDIWGNPEVVTTPEAGCLMDNRTPEGIANAVRRLFAALPKRSATRQYAERYSWQDTSDGQLRLFERVVQSHRVSETQA